MSENKNDNSNTALASTASGCYVCDCERMICNKCGCKIWRNINEIGGNGEYETFWYESNAGWKHTHQCLICQQT